MINIDFSLISRRKKQAIMILLDFVILFFTPILSIAIRKEGFIFYDEINFYILLGLSPLIAVPIFINFGLYNAILKYIGINFIATIFYAISLYSVIWFICGLYLDILSFPKSVFLINFIITFLLVSGLRFFVLYFYENFNNIDRKEKFKNILIYGVGKEGIQLLNSFKTIDGYNVVGFVDDDEDIKNKFVKGLKVFSYYSIRDLIISKNINELYISFEIEKKRKKEIINELSDLNISIKVLPSIKKIIKSNFNYYDYRHVELSDLIERDEIQSDFKAIKYSIKNKTIIVTGAGGSIGSEICRQLVAFEAQKIILVENNECSLYEINEELNNISRKKVIIIPLLADIRFEKKISNIFHKYKPDMVYHAAAYKHVPLVEMNVTEGAHTNIIGTYNCITSAIAAKVKTFVFISTDKAVNPKNIMGITKRLAEKILSIYFENNSNSIISIVRFGNVLGSSGSVIPLFKKQINAGGPVTVTHRDVERFFMTIPEAVELVIQASILGKGGEYFILDMGKPKKIDYIAKKMIELSGFSIKNKQNINGDIEIIYTGLRPGEKMFEELSYSKKLIPTDHSLINKIKGKIADSAEIKELLNEIKNLINSEDEKKLRNFLIKSLKKIN